MASSVAEAFVTVRPDFDKFGSDLKSGIGKLAGVAKVAGVAIGAALVGTGVAAFKIGKTFDDAFDTIRVGTGATGKALEGLQGSFRNVVKNVPTDFASASTAIADLNTRLGITGKPLEQLSGQFLELARITETDVSSSIASVTRVFGDWAVETKDQSGTLDMLFRASQATGIGVDELSGKLVQFGAPLRQMGFGFEEATALLASFEREGVNAELVMGSMRIALGKLAREGVTDTKAALTELITSIAEAGSEGEATALSMEYFGARAGSDMAAAIREGRFSVEELVETISNGSETVMKAAEDTRDFSESWQMFKNNVLLVLEPIAVRVFDTIGKKMDQFLAWWQTNGPAVTAKIEDLRDWFVRLGERISKWWNEDAKPAIDEFVSAVRTHWPLVEDIFEDLGAVVKDIASIFSSEVRNMASSSEEGEADITTSVRDILVMLSTLAETTRRITNAVSMSWDLLAGAVTGNIPRMVQAVDGFTGGALTRFSETTGAKIREVIGWFANLPGAIGRAVGNLGSLLYNAGRDLLAGLVRGIASKVGDAVAAVKNAVGSVVRGAKGALGIRSPSKVFMDIGEQTTAGLLKGLTADQGKVSRVMTGMLDLPKVPSAPGTAAGASKHYHLTVNSSATDATVAEQFRRMELLHA